MNAPASHDEAAPARREEAPRRTLAIGDGQGERSIALVGRVIAGRAPECELRTDDVRASRVHAEFIVDGDVARVRDLDSRNGVTVNGVPATDHALATGDVVRIANLEIEYREQALASATSGDRDRTQVVPAVVAAAAAVIAPGPVNGASADIDATRVVPPPGAEASRRSDVAPPAVVAAATAAIAPTPVNGASADTDGTRVVPPPRAEVTRRNDLAPPNVVAAVPVAPGQPPAAVRIVEAPRAAAAPTATSVARVRRSGSWAGRLALIALPFALLVWGVSAVPQAMLVGRVGAAHDVTRATAIASWLASEAARALDAGTGIADAANAVLSSPGVEEALIVDRASGRVLAPGRRTAETIATFQGVGRAPRDVLGQVVATAGDRAMVATPVTTRGGDRAAAAWVSVQARPPAAAGNFGPILGMSFVLALGAGLLLAAIVRRMTMGAMTRLRDDIELALAGGVDVVDAPLRAREMQETVDVINYLVTRYRVARLREDASAPQGAAHPTTTTDSR